jgi:hypothetical protein
MASSISLPSFAAKTSNILNPDGTSIDQSFAPINGGMFRNRIINGDMRIDQRNSGAAVTVNTAGAFYATDRFRLSGKVADGVFTGQRVADAPTDFTNSLKVTVTTADASLGTSDSYYAVQFIEGNHVADFGFGASTAKTVTLSFWVKSSLTGTFGGALSNSAVTRSLAFSYSIPVANTWTKITMSLAGDTTGTWLIDEGIGLRIYWGLGVGTSLSGTVGTWSASQLISATSAVSVIGTNAATWQITGVQIEAGSSATTFEIRPYALEETLCRRYYYHLTNAGTPPVGNSANYLTTRVFGNWVLPVAMRGAPVILTSGTNSIQLFCGGTTAASTAIAAGPVSRNTIELSVDHAGGAPLSTVGNASFMRVQNGYIAADAEY